MPYHNLQNVYHRHHSEETPLPIRYAAPPPALKILPTFKPTDPPRPAPPTATVLPRVTSTTKRPFKDYNIVEYDFPLHYDDEDESGPHVDNVEQV